MDGDGPTSGVVGIFPTPIFIGRAVVPPEIVAGLKAHFEEAQAVDNVRTALLRHTPMQPPRAAEVFRRTTGHLLPQVREYGEALMGESLAWAVKEIWINRMEEGGAQRMHNHANSFVSGVLYLTEVDESASTVFHRHVGATTFVMANENKRCRIGPHNAPVYRMPSVAPGDLVLFPSYLMHEVPPNRGAPRMTAAFNALPERLDSWGYTLSFR
jgi:uncharacterized protein (TIGR02466 family)